MTPIFEFLSDRTARARYYSDKCTVVGGYTACRAHYDESGCGECPDASTIARIVHWGDPKVPRRAVAPSAQPGPRLHGVSSACVRARARVCVCACVRTCACACACVFVHSCVRAFVCQARRRGAHVAHAQARERRQPPLHAECGHPTRLQMRPRRPPQLAFVSDHSPQFTRHSRLWTFLAPRAHTPRRHALPQSYASYGSTSSRVPRVPSQVGPKSWAAGCYNI